MHVGDRLQVAVLIDVPAAYPFNSGLFVDCHWPCAVEEDVVQAGVDAEPVLEARTEVASLPVG